MQAGETMSSTSMDEAFERAVVGWDIRNWSHALPFWQRYIDRHHPRRALAIGEREGGLSLWLASQDIEVVCTDLDGSLEAARRSHEQFGVGQLVTYEAVDVTAIPHPEQSFDLVMFKSVIGALQTKERQFQAINEMHRVLRPGGILLFAENLVGTRFHRWLRSRFVRWGQRWRYLHLEQDLDLFADFDEVEFETWGVCGLLGRDEAQRDRLGRIDDWVSPRVPRAWRYIVFGACRKKV
jgi:SAM-dependent methyltransferase